MPIEIRSSLDPYTVWAEAEYNLGRDLTIFFWLSIVFMATSFVLTMIIFVCVCCVIKKERTLSSRGRKDKSIVEKNKSKYAKNNI